MNDETTRQNYTTDEWLRLPCGICGQPRSRHVGSVHGCFGGYGTYWNPNGERDYRVWPERSSPDKARPAPQMTGWICGNNYRKRGRIIESKGVPQGEPWYETEDGTKWSSFDVRFVPDAQPVPAPACPVTPQELRAYAAHTEDWSVTTAEKLYSLADWLEHQAPDERPSVKLNDDPDDNQSERYRGDE